MKKWQMAALLGSILLLSGCLSLGNNKFSCKAPDGIVCKSVSGVYFNTLENARNNTDEGTPGTRDPHTDNHGDSPGVADDRPRAVKASLARGPMYADAGPLAPVRTPSRELRIWYAPWLDADGGAHDESYVYVVVEEGRWQIQKKLEGIRETYAGGSGARPANAVRKVDVIR